MTLLGFWLKTCHQTHVRGRDAGLLPSQGLSVDKIRSTPYDAFFRPGKTCNLRISTCFLLYSTGRRPNRARGCTLPPWVGPSLVQTSQTRLPFWSRAQARWFVMMQASIARFNAVCRGIASKNARRTWSSMFILFSPTQHDRFVELFQRKVTHRVPVSADEYTNAGRC